MHLFIFTLVWKVKRLWPIKTTNLFDLLVFFCVHLVLIPKEFQDKPRMVVLNLATQQRGVSPGSPWGGQCVRLPIAPQAVTSGLSLQFLCLDFVSAVPLFLHPFRASGKERGNWRWGSGMWVEDLAGIFSVPFLSCLSYSGHLFSSLLLQQQSQCREQM